MTDVDLGWSPLEPRGKDGRWIHGRGVREALDAAEPGSRYESPDGEHDGFIKLQTGWWQPTYNPALNHRRTEGVARLMPKGNLLSPEDQRIRKERQMNERDRERLSHETKKTRAKAGSRVLKALDNIAGQPGTLPNGEKVGDHFYTNLANFVGDEIDLDWTKWNQTRKPGSVGLRPAGAKPVPTRRAPAAGNARAKREIENFKKYAGLKGNNATLGHAALKALKARASQPGHFRAKAILAASRGNTARANKFEAAHQAAHQLRVAQARIAGRPAPKKPAQVGWQKPTTPKPPRPVVVKPPTVVKPPVVPKPPKAQIGPKRKPPVFH